MISRLHHIEFGVRDPDALVAKLTHQFGFSPYAHRVAAGLNQFVMATGNNVFIIVTELSDEKLKAFESFSPPAFTPGTTADELATRVNSVYNIAFEVEDISDIGKRLVANREIAPTIQSGVVTDDNGSVRYVTVKSCVGDVIHTLLDKREYKGPFLPTYSIIDLPPANYPPSRLSDLYTHVDHIAFGLPEKGSPEVLKWYTDVLNCKRIMANSDESQDTGLVVMAGDHGLRLRAVEVQECRPTFTLVLCEPVIVQGDGNKNGQKLFLDHHGGPGVHHIALCTTDIVRTITRLEESKVVFVPNPPDIYYEDISSAFGNSSKTLFVPEMKEHGILIDLEKVSLADCLTGQTEKFLLQKFCRPLVDKTGETVFFEFIERRGGARAFGAGNVEALWKSLIRQFDKDQTTANKKEGSQPKEIGTTETNGTA